MAEPIMKIAVVGYGGMGQWHADKAQSIPGMTLHGIYDIDPQQTALAESRAMKTYHSYEAVLQDPDIDLITLAVPNDLHHPMAIAAMKAGKNVVCEKPVSLNSQELQSMLDTAREHRVLFTVHQNRRWDEDFLTVKKLYDEGTLGEIFSIESRVHGSRGIPGDWRGKAKHGGGMVLDWGVHLLDQILMMLSERKLLTVQATLFHVTNGEVDDGFRVILTFDRDLDVLVEVGTANFISLPRWYVLGQNGTSIVKNWDLSGESVMISDWENKDAIPVVTAAGLTKTMAPRTADTIQSYPLPTVHADISDFYKNIREVLFFGAQPIVKGGELLKNMHLIETIFASGTQHQTLPFTFSEETEAEYNAPYTIKSAIGLLEKAE